MPYRWTWDVREYGPQPTERDKYGMPDGVVALEKLIVFVDERREAVAAIDAEPVACERRKLLEKRRSEDSLRIGGAAERQKRIAEINI